MHAADPQHPPTGTESVQLETRTPRRFYAGLMHRYARYLALLVVIVLTYSALSSFRLGAVGFILDCVRVHLAEEGRAPGEESSGEGRAGAASGSVAAFERLWRSVMPESVEPITGDLGSGAGLRHFVLVMAVVLGVVSLGLGLSFYFKETLAQKTFISMIVDVRFAVFRHLTRQSVSFFHSRQSGDLISRTNNDVLFLQEALKQTFECLWQLPFIILSRAAIALWASPFLFLVSLPVFIAMVLPAVLSSRRMLDLGRGRQQKLGVLTETLHQFIGGVRIVKAFGMEDDERVAFDRKNREFGQAFRSSLGARTRTRALLEVAYNVGFVALFVVGTWLITGQDGSRISVGRFFTFFIAMTQLFDPIKRLSAAWTVVQESVPSVERILEILREEPRVQDRPGARDFPGLRSRLALEGVSFSYEIAGEPRAGGTSSPQPARALRDVTLEARAGEVVALVGPSGAGKSTLVDLIARFYDPQEGRVVVDGIDIRDFRHASYLGAISIVSQDPFLFNTTIRENIRYGRRHASDDEVEAAARAAFAHEFILQQPDAYDTVIGDRGVKLSGGQRQRLTIARAILKNAPILILDEATSALDSEAEKEVQRAIENLMRERTTFVIAHRLSTIVAADRIVVLEKGRIIESGRHDELLAREGRYYQLCTSQGGLGLTAGALSAAADDGAEAV